MDIADWRKIAHARHEDTVRTCGSIPFTPLKLADQLAAAAVGAVVLSLAVGPGPASAALTSWSGLAISAAIPTCRSTFAMP